MKNQFSKVEKYLSLLNDARWTNIKKTEGISICPCGYKKGNTPPPTAEFVPFENGSLWGDGTDSHVWFRFPCIEANENTFLKIETERGGWNVDNPQFIAYLDGKMKQGLDTNHREIYLGDTNAKEITLYAYTGAKVSQARLYADFRELVPEVNELYYDIRFPFELISCMDAESAEYAHILYMLYKSVSLLELYDIGSKEFLASVKRADEYIKNELYGNYTRTPVSKAVCIGHTHIDCAWLWTLKQTREKVQRSFSTVLELMRHYPEYKFMSSQALLYKYLKEEAPEVYDQVADKIAEGRWECEGAMWVEADCNLTSGESLVRQILYGKNFFKKEFGVDNRVLWLPNVFGYSAALPQILRKSGVDWFVTSKISWNDTNEIPYNIFSWRGIDGTEINSYFLTANDSKNWCINNSKKYRLASTYNATTEPRQAYGAYERHKQKHLNDEALVTFGYGDGGGGPTAEQLELALRGAAGIAGAPQTKIEFAGDFLSRLEGRIKNNPDLPRWEGELYLEYHRGTYTTAAKNKKNNRQSEFLYLDAELLSSIAKELFGDEIPKAKLHEGWEDILTNQFHDIIPGSSIGEVYEQCESDYAHIKEIGASIVSGTREKIAAAIDEKHGYVIFNPHSFEGSGLVKVEGRSAYVSKIAPKGYTATANLSFDNHVKIIGKTVETDALSVIFNDAWQIISIYDKANRRELLNPNSVGNQLRVYADFPDKYDAWEWKEYSTHEYRVIDAVSSIEAVDDGARRGIKIVRPYMSSVITQTVWFTDKDTYIEFETEVDWHEHNQMLKVAFPVDIHTDKAIYEIQFGTIERPTHTNTSWDAAKYEVCGHKYADLSEGNFGISLLNDCKYGHDIHDGVMMLSLLRSPTYPNPESDQGVSCFTYGIYSHKGQLKDCETARLAYYLNYPMVALKAIGSVDTIPDSFSTIGINSDHVICETVKEEEQGSGTILRLYEHKNIRDRIIINIGLSATKAYLCDMMENELCELPITDGKMTLDVKGFEILTVKLK